MQVAWKCYKRASWYEDHMVASSEHRRKSIVMKSKHQTRQQNVIQRLFFFFASKYIFNILNFIADAVFLRRVFFISLEISHRSCIFFGQLMNYPLLWIRRRDPLTFMLLNENMLFELNEDWEIRFEIQLKTGFREVCLERFGTPAPITSCQVFFLMFVFLLFEVSSGATHLRRVFSSTMQTD